MTCGVKVKVWYLFVGVAIQYSHKKFGSNSFVKEFVNVFMNVFTFLTYSVIHVTSDL